jgi:hypothetical protein
LVLTGTVWKRRLRRRIVGVPAAQPDVSHTSMTRRARNSLFFVCSLVGAMFLFLGIMALVRGGDDWWLYLLGAAFSILCLLTPGVRFRRGSGKPDV